jgi:tRNA nucleotidyltransferase/poly(A) polymerase
MVFDDIVIVEKPVMNVDATPDREYPLRILRAYRENCNVRFADTSTGEEPKSPMLKMMNKLCDERAKILDEAIEILEKYMLNK